MVSLTNRLSRLKQFFYFLTRWFVFFYYCPITRTFKGNREKFELSWVRVIASLKKITASKKISKWMGVKAIKQQSKQEWTLNLNWSDKKVTTKNWLGCFEINSMFRTSVNDFFPDLSRAYNMVRVIEGKTVQKWAEGKQKLLRVSGRFELSRVRVTEGKITVNVRRKSRGNRLWFELARGSS